MLDNTLRLLHGAHEVPLGTPSLELLRGIQSQLYEADKSYALERVDPKTLTDSRESKDYCKQVDLVHLLYKAVLERMELLLDMIKGTYVPLDLEGLQTKGADSEAA